MDVPALLREDVCEHFATVMNNVARTCHPDEQRATRWLFDELAYPSEVTRATIDALAATLHDEDSATLLAPGINRIIEDTVIALGSALERPVALTYVATTVGALFMHPLLPIGDISWPQVMLVIRRLAHHATSDDNSGTSTAINGTAPHSTRDGTVGSTVDSTVGATVNDTVNGTVNGTLIAPAPIVRRHDDDIEEFVDIFRRADDTLYTLDPASRYLVINDFVTRWHCDTALPVHAGVVRAITTCRSNPDVRREVRRGLLESRTELLAKLRDSDDPRAPYASVLWTLVRTFSVGSSLLQCCSTSLRGTSWIPAATIAGHLLSPDN